MEDKNPIIYHVLVILGAIITVINFLALLMNFGLGHGEYFPLNFFVFVIALLFFGLGEVILLLSNQNKILTKILEKLGNSGQNEGT